MDDCPTNTVITYEKYIEINSWSKEDALKANESWVENDCDQGWIQRDPIMLWEIVQNIKHCKKLHDEGDKRAHLHALHLSLFHNLPTPLWITKAFTKSYNDINHFNAKGWDDVFGQPYPKSTNINSRRKMRSLCLKVYDRVKEIISKNPKTAIDVKLFEEVGKEFAIGRTLATKYYYLVQQKLPQTAPRRKASETT